MGGGVPPLSAPVARAPPSSAEMLSVEQATEIAVGWYNDGEAAGGEGSPQRNQLQEKAIGLLEQVVAADLPTRRRRTCWA